MFHRLKNLWELSKYAPRQSDSLPTSGIDNLVLEQVLFPEFKKKKQRLATIIEDKPDIFPDEPKTD